MQRSGDEDRPPEAQRWTVRDAIDFEALLQRDDVSVPFVEVASNRRIVFREWLERRRAQSSIVLPGERYERGRRVVSWLAALTGLVIGGGLVGSLLSRGDAEPVNALLFFGETVGIQLMVLALAVFAWLLGKMKVRFQPLRDLLLMGVRSFGRIVDRLDGNSRTALRARWAAIDLRSASLAPLIGCDMLIVTQLFAMAFNVGLLCAMLLVYLPFVELRFGWQTTYSIGPDGVNAWVRIVSLPWSWIASGLAPDALQIAATQFTRGQSATTLAATAAHAWWPFLVWAIVFYGLVVRAALAVAAYLVLRVRLARLGWTQPAAHALWRRLTGPLVVAEANGGSLPDVTQESFVRRGGGNCLLISDSELDKAKVERIFIDSLKGSFTANVDDDALRDDLVTALRGSSDRIVVATSTQRDPVIAVADFLRAVSAASRPGVELTVFLVGNDISEERVTVWSRFLAIHRIPFSMEPPR